MSTRRRNSISERLARLVPVGCAIVAVAVTSAPGVAHSDDDARLRAAYPMVGSSTLRAAGIDLAKLSLPGLKLSVRDDRGPANGGTTMSFVDSQGQVQLVIRFAVTTDTAPARAFAYARLRAITTTLSASTLDELAFTNDTGSIVVGVHGNVAYQIDAQGSVSGTDVAKALGALFVAGTPSFPRGSLVMPPSLPKEGAPFSLTAPAATTTRFLAKNGYVTKLRGITTLHPSSAGRVEITAIIGDDLGRVTELTGSTQAL